MHVLSEWLAAKRCNDLGGEEPALPHRVLSVWYNSASRRISRKIGLTRVVSRCPRLLNEAIFCAHRRSGRDQKVPSRVDREIGVTGDHRIGVVTCGSDDDIGLKGIPRNHRGSWRTPEAQPIGGRREESDPQCDSKECGGQMERRSLFRYAAHCHHLLSIVLI
jgi:hypothetical protein